MNPLPPLHVQTDTSVGDSSLSTNNDEDENRSVNSGTGFSRYSQGDRSLANPVEFFSAISGTSNIQYPQCTPTSTNPTPRFSNRTRILSNSEAVANVEHLDGVAAVGNELFLKITTRPIMSWSPKVVHANGSSHTMTIDLPEEFVNSRTIVITQQGWQDLYHLVATAVAKNTSESILLFWLSGFLLIIMALILLFGLVKGIGPRLGVMVGVLLFTSFCGITHALIRRVRVHNAVRRCVEECFYDAEAAANASARNVLADARDIERPMQQPKEPSQNPPCESSANERDTTNMSGILDGLQELEDVANVDGVDISTGGFGQALRQRLKSGDSSTPSRPNRQRLNTGGDSSVSSAMIFDTEDPRRNRAVSRDGMYCVSWKWENLGMDAVVKISWED
ncbi:unnamed protein product [Pseudo-nitzschia multistriata]|uniref:Uncharacterized protein n=1 Tax=Pseudo-nitzschia multistriata TaxID=183589 RepID=A0A448YWL5_9STRA|nr:unnamed protein product [Pseudo-nitzschia multistriata]